MKAIFALKSIYVHRQSFNEATRRMLCDSLVLSHFNFGDVVYSNCVTGRDSQRIQMVQNSCTRLIHGIRGRRGVTRLLSASGSLNMSNRRKMHAVLFYCKILNFKTPAYLYNKVRFRRQEHDLNFRRNNLLSVPKFRMESFRRSFSYDIAKALNYVLMTRDINIYASTSTIAIKLKIRLLLEQYGGAVE
jgi:hypothetical protein